MVSNLESNASLKAIKKLVVAILILSLRDLRTLYLRTSEGKKNKKYPNRLSRHGKENLVQVVGFWREDAKVFLDFVFGSYRANLFLKKLDPVIQRLEREIEQELPSAGGCLQP